MKQKTHPKVEGVTPESFKCETEDSKNDSSAFTGFPVLGGFESRPVHKVNMVLPQWLAEPDVIHRDIKFNLVPISSASGISAQLLRKLETNGIQHFFPGTAEASVGHQPGLFVALLGETTINSEACVMQYDNAAF
ncbi:hypothetical protein AMECASPLE_039503 [Ameca splendens]|uniref:Uncharacterized protein n=1 Tax=Ameca splendens TaxID=208324 RepID=A0ABV0ZH87_9TELE